jgi:hypothetical protein
MAFEIKYSKEAEENLDAITAWLLYERLAGETALRWLQGLREKIMLFLSNRSAAFWRVKANRCHSNCGNCCMAANRACIECCSP